MVTPILEATWLMSKFSPDGKEAIRSKIHEKIQIITTLNTTSEENN